MKHGQRRRAFSTPGRSQVGTSPEPAEAAGRFLPCPFRSAADGCRERRKEQLGRQGPMRLTLDSATVSQHIGCFLAQ
jgi:hypothetical protein